MKKNRLIVQKYGGTSVSDVKKIENAASRIKRYYKNGYKVIAVVSAMGHTTDELISLAKKINPYPIEREMDMLISTGEQISCALLTMALHKKGIDAVSFVGHQAGIITDTIHTKAKIIKINASRLKKAINRGKVAIVAGFQGISPQEDITTLGRGGSDLTAVALAAILGAEVCEIYTDVSGIYTADPRIEPKAKKLDYISFDEMLELASRGAQVMHTRAVEVAKKFNLPLHIRGSFTNKEGTIVMQKNAKIEEPAVRGIAIAEDEVKVTICDVLDKPGIAAVIFSYLAKANINVDMIVQNVSRKGTTDISFTVAKDNLPATVNAIKKNVDKIKANDILVDENIAKISIIGVGMKVHSGVAAKCFSALAKSKINIEMISTSEISISCVVRKQDGKKAVRALHSEFGLSRKINRKK